MRPIGRSGRRVPALEVFVFFSNNLGCVGSIVVSLIGTVILLLLLGVINLS
jgi:hypothetical protein